MKLNLDIPNNANYAASIVEIKNTIALEKCDNIVATSIFGFQAIISKETKAGTIGVFFPAECQLSEEFCRENNLYRHKELNKDVSIAGYIEDNRRVRAMKFRGHRSDCFFLSLDSLAYTGININDLSMGDTFDILNGKEICRKYLIKTSIPNVRNPRKTKIFNRVDTKYIPEHFNTDNYMKVEDRLPDNAQLIVTQKLHGTSVRIANTIVKRKLGFFESILKRIGVKIQESEYDYVFGSRKVIKDINNPSQDHYYDVDIWTIKGKEVEGIIPENYIVYAEIIGFTPNKAAIQQGYTYNLEEGFCSMYVYRVAHVNNSGLVMDLSWDQVVEFCKNNGLNWTPEIWRGYKKDFYVTNYLDKRFFDEGSVQCVKLSNKDTVDEGVCVRIDGLIPYIMKAKSPLFYEHETKLLDKGVEDLESVQSESNI